jgi:hypothetical protein
MHDSRHDKGQGDVAVPAGRAEQGGQAEFPGHRVNSGDVPVRDRPGDRDRRRPAGQDERIVLQRGLDQVDHVAGQLRQVGEGLVADFAAVAVGAAQQPRLVLPPLFLPVGVQALNPGYMYRGRLLHHDRSVAGWSRELAAARHDFPGYIKWPQEGSRAWSGTRFLLGGPVTSG